MRQVSGCQHLAQLLLLVQDALPQLLLLPLVVFDLRQRRLQTRRFRADVGGQPIEFGHDRSGRLSDARVAADAGAEMHLSEWTSD